MNIVIAPDSFKESMSAIGVAEQIALGFQKVYPDAHYTLTPVADGGEGTVEALVNATGGKRVKTTVTGPLGEPVEAEFGLTGDGKTAVVEMASASGLMLLTPEQRQPLNTTSYGTGELLIAAARHGVSQIIMGIGGSATNDGGAGLLQAVGVKLFDINGQELPFGGGSLSELAVIDSSELDPELKRCQITIACDVSNPLTGPNGASAVFGPQKGATPEMIARLDTNLNHYAQCLAQHTGIAIADYPGSGAGGGITASLLTVLNAKLYSGIELIMEVVNLEASIREADLVITGEGRIDSQSINGKVPVGVAKLAKKYQKPVIGIAGCLSDDVEVVYGHGLDCIFSVILRPCSLQQAFEETRQNLVLSARNIARLYQLGEQATV